ncbi:hypothetical protein RHMOL_Rhmol10G0210600 [Rhododendron molle]|uniref:Uncharacterized protein n=1 Tax=Rhododendron molle TaxID=49168 RepID=A0ACC0M656_RHOML|nr:hypothetical protein RHMOL_Rhmol10G0210600 [Rhododendron molle]
MTTDDELRRGARRGAEAALDEFGSGSHGSVGSRPGQGFEEFSCLDWLVDLLIDEYQKNFGDSWRTMQADSTQPWPYLNEALTKFQDPAEAQRELDESKIFPHMTIDSVLGQMFESVVAKISDLSAASQCECICLLARTGVMVQSWCIMTIQEAAREEKQAMEKIATILGQYRKDDCFNMALGFGLFYLLAASKNEITEMIQLRKELEMLLQNAQEKPQSQNRAILSKPSQSNVIWTCSIIDVQESLFSYGIVSLQSQFLFLNQVDSETPKLCDQSLTCKTSRQEKCIQGMDQLEAELEAELEQM